MSVTGTYTCLPQGACEIQTTDGNVVGILGTGQLLFTTTDAQVTVAAVAADPKVDYLLFGVWLQEAANGTAASFGVFADSGDVDNDNEFETAVTLTGTATYRGAATGLYSEGTSIDYFQGRATLTANFGAPGTADNAEDPDDEEGIIFGTIDNIYAGGRRMSDVINLNSDHDRTVATDGNITTDGVITGNTRMGAAMVDGDVVTYTYTGSWGGQFYGPDAATDAEGADTLPPSVAGTFGVSGTDEKGTDTITDDVTRSYLGAFGAHKN